MDHLPGGAALIGHAGQPARREADGNRSAAFATGPWESTLPDPRGPG